MIWRSIRLIAAWCAIAISPWASAQPAGALGDDFVYRIQPGDTLIDLATLYTRSNANWTTLQRHNTIADPLRLVIGSELRIPFDLIPEIPSKTTAIHVSGQAQVDGMPLQVGMSIDEGSTVTTTADGFVTLQLSDGTKLTLPRGSATQLQRLRQFEGAALTDSILRVQEGEVDSHVAPSGQGVGRFEIRTPVAIMGVRGTRFRVQANGHSAQSEVLDGHVRLQTQPGHPSSGRSISLASGYGAAVGADGVLHVQRLLPAPTLGPARRAGSGQWTAPVTPVPGAVGYLVQVSRDKEGLELTSSQQFDNTDILFSARRSGTHYVSVRAIDSAGLGGRDAQLTFEGANALLSASGLPVMLSDGGVVTLTDY